jgi:hypothetical protein
VSERRLGAGWSPLGHVGYRSETPGFLATSKYLFG